MYDVCESSVNGQRLNPLKRYLSPSADLPPNGRRSSHNRVVIKRKTEHADNYQLQGVLELHGHPDVNGLEFEDIWPPVSMITKQIPARHKGVIETIGERSQALRRSEQLGRSVLVARRETIDRSPRKYVSSLGVVPLFVL